METEELTAANLRDRAIHEAENWLMAFGALIPADQIENLSIKLAADIAKPAIETVVAQADQIAEARRLHQRCVDLGDGGSEFCAEDGSGWPCNTARALGLPVE